jgi:DinB superfamily
MVYNQLMFTLESATVKLSQQAKVIQSLVQGATQEQALWKPDKDQWSLLEVINHLADEEQEDFRKRFDLMLHQPGTEWPTIDPKGWVTERSYNTRDLAESLERFLLERDKSLTWLKGLPKVNLEQAHIHPPVGPVRAADLLASWLAHDLLHIRQITRLHYQYLQMDFEIDYAGDW